MSENFGIVREALERAVRSTQHRCPRLCNALGELILPADNNDVFCWRCHGDCWVPDALSLLRHHRGLQGRIDFCECDGTERSIVWQEGDPSVGIPSGWEADDKWTEHKCAS